jgi:hypothetical protein
MHPFGPLSRLQVLLPLFATGLLLVSNYDSHLAAFFVEPTSSSHQAASLPEGCAQHGWCHHHPLMRASHTGSATATRSQQAQHLTPPKHAAVAHSRAELQTFLASPEFLATAAAAGNATAQALLAAGGLHGTHYAAHTRGILIAAGGRKLLTHLLVQLKARQQAAQSRMQPGASL